MLKALPDIPKPDWRPKDGRPTDWQAYDDWIYGEGNCIYADYGANPDHKYSVVSMTRCFVCEIFYRGPCGFDDIVGRFRDSLRLRPYYWICKHCRTKPERPDITNV